MTTWRLRRLQHICVADVTDFHRQLLRAGRTTVVMSTPLGQRGLGWRRRRLGDLRAPNVRLRGMDDDELAHPGKKGDSALRRLENEVLPAWLRPTRGENRIPVAVVIVFAAVMQLLLPSRFTLLPLHWLIRPSSWPCSSR